MIKKAGGKLHSSFELGILTHITERFTAGAFKYAIEKVLTPRRISKLEDKPLTINEFIGPLSASDFYVSVEENILWLKFTHDACKYKARALKAGLIIANE